MYNIYMRCIDNIAFNKGIRGEDPNKELEKELAESESIEGIKEMTGFLYDKKKSIASDCIAVLYHVGYLKPKLISEYIDIFLDLLKSKINRIVWGGMIAISTIVEFQHKTIFKNIDFIIQTIENGSLITQIHGINTLAKLSLLNPEYKGKIQPILFEYLRSCRPIDFPKRVEVLQPTITTEEDIKTFNSIIDFKIQSLSETQRKKVQKLLK